MAGKKEQRKLNLGCGIHLLAGFVNVDVAFTKEELEEGVKTGKGLYQNARIEEGAEFVQADATKLPFADDEFDYIESSDFLEHLPMIRVLDVLKEIRRVLKPGGRLCLVTNDFTWVAYRWMLLESKESEMDEREYFTEWSRIAMSAYGNQVGLDRKEHGDAEFHKVPFSPRSLGIFMKQAGWDVKNKLKIVLFNEGAPTPMLEQRRDKEGCTLAVGEIYIEAYK